MKETPRMIIPIGTPEQIYKISGVTYHVKARYQRNYEPQNVNDFRSRISKCLISDKKLLTRLYEDDIISTGTVCSAAKKEVTA